MRRCDESARLGLVVPLQGPAGMFGPSCEAVAATAVRSINEAGVLGRELAVEVIDGGASPDRVGAEVGRLVDAGRIDAGTGWHISAGRAAAGAGWAGRGPYRLPPPFRGGRGPAGGFSS